MDLQLSSINILFFKMLVLNCLKVFYFALYLPWFFIGYWILKRD
jgi:hypothetical protein